MTNLANAANSVVAANPASSATPSRARTVAYWTLTLMIAWEMVDGSVWDLLRIEYVRVVLTHLGYPLYVLFILGTWKLPCAVVLLLPRFPRLKEWAYAGAFFNYSGAFASHSFVGDGFGVRMAPLALAILALGSWAFRPPQRRLPSAGPSTDIRPVEWVVPIVITVVMLVAALLTLPKKPPSF
jgi:DoxX-like protein